MSEDTTITLIGNVVDQVEMRFTTGGAAVAKFRIASTPRFFDKTTQAWKDGDALFLTVNVWRDMAERVTESVEKGCRVVVVGKLRMRSFETKAGEKRTVFEVEADEVAVSLKFATAKVQRMSRSGGQSNGGGARQPDADPWGSAAPAGSGGPFYDEPPF
jgi:single-strand DNA-binding protein